MNNTTLKLGDTVRGDYLGTIVEGVIKSYDSVGGVYLTLSKPYNGRSSLCFDRFDSHTLRLVKAGPALAAEDVVELPGWAMGGMSLR